jgi:hypothetical protein
VTISVIAARPSVREPMMPPDAAPLPPEGSWTRHMTTR